MPAKVVKIASYPHWFVFYRDMTHALLNHGGGAGRGGGGGGQTRNFTSTAPVPLGICTYFDKMLQTPKVDLN